MTAVANYIPAPKSVELHLSPSPEFSRYSKKVKALGGRYNQCRGNAHRRFVTLPWTDEGRTLANELVFEFRTGPKTTLIVRGDDSFRGKHIHAWVIVHKIDAGDADACGSLLSKYEDAFLKAFPGAADPEPQPEPVKEPTLVDFLVEFGLELTLESNGISRYVRDNVQVSVDTVYGGIEIVALESDGFTEKRRLVLPAHQWSVHAAAEIVRAVLRERHS
jgi:hypothetical protein